MTNVKLTVNGTTLTLSVELEERHGSSSTGKTMIVGTTGGSVKLPPPFEHISAGLTVFTKDFGA